MEQVAADLSLNSANTFTLIGAAISAMAALGLAAMALVDASKALWGGIANIGFGHILRGCAPFKQVLDKAAGNGLWVDLLRAQWRNGRDKESQKALARSLVRLGLTEKTAEGLMLANIETGNLATLARKASAGDELKPAEVEMMGRIDALVGYHIDAAFEKADQQYRNVTRVCAGLVAVALSVAAARLLDMNLWIGVMAGLLSVPVAPLAKDLTSSLTAAVTAVKAVRRAR